jgi:spore germination protein KA
MYLDGVANPAVLDTVKFRLSGLDVDAILESGYIEEYIEDAPFLRFRPWDIARNPM